MNARRQRKVFKQRAQDNTETGFSVLTIAGGETAGLITNMDLFKTENI